MTIETQEKINEILNRYIDNTISRMKKDKTCRPFHEALLTKELVTASSFERSFSTSFGQGPIEEISNIVAVENGYKCVRQKETMVNVYKGAIDEIERILSSLRSGDMKPNWKQEIKKIQAYRIGDTVVRRIISDLWLSKNNSEIYISIKTVKPNLDQTEIAKRTMLLLKAHDNNFKTFFGLYYNPGGLNRQDYNWTMPSKLFDMHNDPCVLIGKEYWNMIGGEKAYQNLLDVFKDVGTATQKKLNKNGSTGFLVGKPG